VNVALSLGGNLGPVRERLVEALLALRRFLDPGGEPGTPGAAAFRVSPLYRTTPVVRSAAGRDATAPAPPQPPYLNAAAAGTTRRTAAEILAFGHQLERRAGRRRVAGERDAPRPLDVDLLVWGDTVAAGPELTLPHPRLAERAFVLVPLARVAPDLPVPPAGATVAELLRRLGPVSGVERVPWGAAAARRLGLDAQLEG
jgi:2-amino-4-hydroxy-6-hydroxymethyldihydropteridine diphosphokinase